MKCVNKEDYREKLLLFYRFMLLIFGVFEIAIVWVMSVFFICYISSDVSEKTFFCKDNYLLNIALLIVFFVLLVLLKRSGVLSKCINKLDDDAFFEKTKKVLLRIIFIIGLAWILITQYVPGSDQLDVLSSAYKYGIHATDMVEAGGYLDKWPHNIGITTIERLLAIIVGDYNVIFMQLLNLPGLVLIYKIIVDTWNKLGGSRISQICTLICGIVFYPMIMYVSFVYGNIWSVTFALIAYEAVIDYFDTKKDINILKCAIAIGMSFVIKGSGIIFLIAICIYAIIRGIMDKAKLYKIAMLVLACSISVSLFGIVPKAALSKSTGHEIRDDGIWSFVAMGLQEHKTTAGWYNGYCLNVYYDNNRDAKLAEKIAKEETFNRLNYLFSDKHHAYEFFSKKIASMWIEPTYQGYWINQVREHRVDFPAWLDSFMTAKGYTVAAKIFNYFLIIIYTGTLLWLLLANKDSFNRQSFFVLSFVGGFTFNLFWEAKSQYSITYFILLFPCAISGFELLLNKEFAKLKLSNKVMIVYSLLIVSMYMIGYKMDASNCLSQHNAVYEVYLDTWKQNYMNESVLDVNNMKAQLKADEENIIHFIELLNENGIPY